MLIKASATAHCFVAHNLQFDFANITTTLLHIANKASLAGLPGICTIMKTSADLLLWLLDWYNS
jgi:hypothetical protein